MAKKEVRFAVTDGTGRRAATWKLWVQTSKWGQEIYLTCRELGGALHTSFHATGHWHTTLSREAYERLKHDGSQPRVARHIEEWPRPAEVKPGIILAYKILTPWSATTTPFARGKKKIIEIPCALSGRANETMILIVRPGQLEIRNASLIWQTDLAGGSKLVVVNHEIEMPTMPASASGAVRYFQGKTAADLESNNLRALAFTNDQNGHRIIMDAPIAPRASSHHR